MHSTLFYQAEMDRRSARLMPQITALARQRKAFAVRGLTKAAAKRQARIERLTLQMGDMPCFVDRCQHGTQLIALFGLDWGQVRERFADSRGHLTPSRVQRLLAHLEARETVFARNARTTSGSWLFRNLRQERRRHQQYANLRAYLQQGIQRKEVIGIQP